MFSDTYGFIEGVIKVRRKWKLKEEGGGNKDTDKELDWVWLNLSTKPYLKEYRKMLPKSSNVDALLATLLCIDFKKLSAGKYLKANS